MKMVEGQPQAFPLPACTDIVVQVCNQFKRIPLAFEIGVKEDNVLLARVEGDKMSRGGGIPGCIFDLLDFCAMKNLLKLNRRDWIDLACWLMVSILIGQLALPVMVGREIYQYKHYKLERFEWEDVVRYSVIIILGSLINYFIFMK